jgi:solute carrier family 25 phosphate transporter 23/24/25/41
MNEDKPTLRSAEKNILAGGVAGCVAKTITAPLSRLTVLYQVGSLLDSHAQGSLTRVGVSDSLYKTLNDIIRKEGLLSLWRGNFTSAVIHRFPYSAIQFSSFEALKTLITHHADSSHDTLSIRFLCGSVSGAISCIACYPLDIVRTRLIVAAAPTSSVPRMSSRILHLLTDIVHREGWKGLYRGLGATLTVTMPTMGIGFAVYGKVKDALLAQGPGVFVNAQGTSLSPYGALLSGSVSGVLSATSTFPGDVIRKRMQVMGAMVPSSSSSSSSPAIMQATGMGLAPSYRPVCALHSKGIAFHAQLIYSSEGVRGFYRGLLPEVLKVCPTVAIMFCAYELAKAKLEDLF